MRNKSFIALECKQLFRSRWIQIVSVLFTVLFTSIIVIQQLAMPDIEGFSRQTAALLNGLLFLLPLFLLTLGSMNVASDVETGWFGLLMTYPVTVSQYVRSKYSAILFTFSLMVVLALSVVFLIGGSIGGVKLPLVFIFLTTETILIFASISVALGSMVKNRLHALAVALGVWVVVTLLFSYIIMAVGTVIAGHMLQKLTIVLIHLNPLEWIRFSYFLYTDQTAVLGPSFYDFSNFYQSTVGLILYVVFTALWIVVPLLFARLNLSKKGGSNR
ncbi:ABC transporter permease [Solibacillus sp. FSL H8-0538]|uniref:ABC transporter permease n=1 Tax=Solibacillus sp. FSL H8-0538 TaxID=2921400 RepID=UPI0030F62B18